MLESVIFADHALARRLERAEADAAKQFVQARARISPASGALWSEIAGVSATYDGPGSPITQTFGLGLFRAVTAEDLAIVEQFFQLRKAPVIHEVSPLAAPGTMALLCGRGYRPIEFTSVMFRPIGNYAGGSLPLHDRVRVRRAGPSDTAEWTRTMKAGWGDTAGIAEFIDDFAPVSFAAVAAPFLGELDGEAIAAAALCIHEGVSLLAGATTVPHARNQGAQRALLDARLHYASESGCDLAMMGAEPGSASQRNAERQGFRIAYTRVKWLLPAPDGALDQAD